MYFLVRYPGVAVDRRNGLMRSRIGVLLGWHREDPVQRCERHRNWLIEKAQGNRNPFIDFPGIATEALLRLGFSER